MKKLVAICYSVLMLTSVSFANDIEILFNGDKLICDVPPVEIENRVLVPVRAILEKAGAIVDFNFDTNVVTITKDSTIVKLATGSKVAHVNDEEKVLDVPATEINDRMMIPVRFVSENLGLNVGWEPGTNNTDIVKITTKNYVVKEDVNQETLNQGDINQEVGDQEDISEEDKKIEEQNRVKLNEDVKVAEGIGMAIRMWLTDGTEEEIKAREESISGEYINYSALKDIGLYVATSYRPSLGKDMSLRYYVGLLNTADGKKIVVQVAADRKSLTTVYGVKGAHVIQGIAYIEDMKIF